MSALAGSRILIVGGTSGIGRATAVAALAAGGATFVASRSPEKLEAASRELSGLAGTIKLDVGDEDSVRATLADREPWDHVVFSAGGVRPGGVRTRPIDEAIGSINVKFWGAYRVAALTPIMRGGSLTLVSGVIGARPQANKVLSGVANAAVESLARGLAVEWAPTRVNVVSPGVIATPAYDTMRPERRQAMFEDVARHLPAGRVGGAEDVAGLILQCMTNRFLTGSVLLVDGGHVLV